MEQLELGPEKKRQHSDRLTENSAMVDNHHDHGHNYSSRDDFLKSYPAQTQVLNFFAGLSCAKADPDYLALSHQQKRNAQAKADHWD